MDESQALEVRHQPSRQLASLEEIKTQIQAIKACIKTIMVEDRHYGKVPGCEDKPSLLLPGAQLLCKLFRLRAKFKRSIVDLGNGHKQFFSECILYDMVTGMEVGEGAGNCSTMEKKYRWRKSGHSCPTCNEEGSIIRSKYPPKNDKSQQPGWYCVKCKAQFTYRDVDIRSQKTGKVENPDIADQYNTCSKMADKRAYVGATITATGASDYVTQDIDDFADDYDQGKAPEPEDQSPKSQEEKKESTTGNTVRDKLVAEAVAIIKDSEQQVTTWAKETGKIKEGQTWRDLEITAINSIVKSGAGFTKMINNYFDNKNK